MLFISIIMFKSITDMLEDVEFIIVSSFLFTRGETFTLFFSPSNFKSNIISVWFPSVLEKRKICLFSL